MGLAEVQGQWVPQQVKAFSRWITEQLKAKEELEIQDVTKDLKNGVVLVELAKILTNKETPRRWAFYPKRNVDMVQNCDLALDMFTKDGVHIIGISGRDINENNEKLILGLIWTLISHYSIGKNKFAIIKWAKERTCGYSNIDKFTPYELSMCALLDSYFPEKIKYDSLDPTDSYHNLELAKKVMKEIGIPVYIDSIDFKDQNGKVDQQILLTQLVAAKYVLENLPQQEIQTIEVKERSINLLTNLENESDQPEKLVNTNNDQYNGRKFGLIMHLKKCENEQEKDYAVALFREENGFMNPAGLKLELEEPNIEKDVKQQFSFGKDSWNTVIDSVEQGGMVFDVCNADNVNPPEGTPFYLFPFHGRHNQHFVFQNGMIFAKQNGMVVTYVGGEIPFQMMNPSQSLKSTQTFTIKLL